MKTNPCPNCHSTEVDLVSQSFGSAVDYKLKVDGLVEKLWRCSVCGECFKKEVARR